MLTKWIPKFAGRDSTLIFAESSGMRGDLTDEEWGIIGELLPAERGRGCRPSHDNRRFINGMHYVLRVGCPWRDMHERYGKWKSVDNRVNNYSKRGV